MRDSNLDYSTNTAADYDSLNIIKVSQGYFFDGFQMRAMAAQGKRRLAGMRHMGLVAFNPDSTAWNRTGSAPEPDTVLGAPAWASASPDTTLDTLFYITFSADSTPVPDSTRVIVARDLFLTTSPETNWTTNDSVLVSFTNEDVGWFYYKARSRYTTRYDTHESDDTALKSLYRHPDAFGAPDLLSDGETVSDGTYALAATVDSTPAPDSTMVIVADDRAFAGYDGGEPDTHYVTTFPDTAHLVDSDTWYYFRAFSYFGPNTSAADTDSVYYEAGKPPSFITFAAAYSGTNATNNIILSVSDSLSKSAASRVLSDTLWYLARSAYDDTMLEDSTGVAWQAAAVEHNAVAETVVATRPSYSADSGFYIAWHDTNSQEDKYVIEGRLNWGEWTIIDTSAANAGTPGVAQWDTIRVAVPASDTTEYDGQYRGIWNFRVAPMVNDTLTGWKTVDSLLYNQAVPVYVTGEADDGVTVTRYSIGDTVVAYSLLPYGPSNVAYADTCISSVVPFAKLSATLPTAGYYKVRGSDDGKSTWAVIDTSQWSQGGAAQTTYDQTLIAIYGNDSTCVEMSEDSVIFQSRYKRFSDDHETAWADEDTVVWADKVGPVFAAAPSFVAWDTTSDAGNVSMQVTATADENASGHWEWKLNAADSWTAFTGSDSAKADATPDTTVETGTAVASVDSVFIRVRGYDEDNNLGEYSASLDSTFTRKVPETGAAWKGNWVIVSNSAEVPGSDTTSCDVYVNAAHSEHALTHGGICLEDTQRSVIEWAYGSSYEPLRTYGDGNDTDVVCQFDPTEVNNAGNDNGDESYCWISFAKTDSFAGGTVDNAFLYIYIRSTVPTGIDTTYIGAITHDMFEAAIDSALGEGTTAGYDNTSYQYQDSTDQTVWNPRLETLAYTDIGTEWATFPGDTITTGSSAYMYPMDVTDVVQDCIDNSRYIAFFFACIDNDDGYGVWKIHPHYADGGGKEERRAYLYIYMAE